MCSRVPVILSKKASRDPINWFVTHWLKTPAMHIDVCLLFPHTVLICFIHPLSKAETTQSSGGWGASGARDCSGGCLGRARSAQEAGGLWGGGFGRGSELCVRPRVAATWESSQLCAVWYLLSSLGPAHPTPRVGTPMAVSPGLRLSPALQAWDSSLRVAACPDMGQTRMWLTWPSILSFLTPAAQNFLRT